MGLCTIVEECALMSCCNKIMRSCRSAARVSACVLVHACVCAWRRVCCACVFMHVTFFSYTNKQLAYGWLYRMFAEFGN